MTVMNGGKGLSSLHCKRRLKTRAGIKHEIEYHITC